MYFNNIPYYQENMYNQSRYNTSYRRPGPPRPPINNLNRPIGPGGFLLPFALGFVSSPLIFGATRPRPYYQPYYFVFVWRSRAETDGAL